MITQVRLWHTILASASLTVDSGVRAGQTGANGGIARDIAYCLRRPGNIEERSPIRSDGAGRRAEVRRVRRFQGATSAAPRTSPARAAPILRQRRDHLIPIWPANAGGYASRFRHLNE